MKLWKTKRQKCLTVSDVPRCERCNDKFTAYDYALNRWYEHLCYHCSSTLDVRRSEFDDRVRIAAGQIVGALLVGDPFRNSHVDLDGATVQAWKVATALMRNAPDYERRFNSYFKHTLSKGASG